MFGIGQVFAVELGHLQAVPYRQTLDSSAATDTPWQQKQ